MHRSSGWIHAGTSWPSQTGATEKVWSKCPCVSSTATGRQPVLREQLLQRLDGVLAGVDHDARLPGSGGQHVAVGLEGPCGKAGDEHVTA